MSTPPPRKSLEPFLRDSVVFYPHQVEGVRTLARRKSFLLADDMGLGKSLQALTVYCIALKMGEAQTCIIVCPVTLRDNWADEIEKFTRLPYTLLGDNPDLTSRKKLTPAKRNIQLAQWMDAEGPRILIVNYEQLVSATHAELFKKFQFDVAIFDEAHYIKNAQSKRTKASLALRSNRSFMLTGTPMLNNVTELWPLLHRIDPTEFPKYWSFVNKYCVFGGYENRQIIGVKQEKDLVATLGRYQLRRRKKDVLDLPDVQYIQVMVGLTELQQKLYDSVEQDLFLPGADDEMSPEEMSNALTKFLRMKQICGTPYCIDPNYEDSSLKLDRAIEILQEKATANEKMVVFTQFRGVIEALDRRIVKSGLDKPFQLHGGVPTGERQDLVKAWGSTSGPSVLVCNTTVAGVGLNMTQARSGMFIDKLFVPGLNQQAVDRMHRIGASKTQPVQVFELLVKGSVEDKIEKILRMKSKLFGNVVEGGTGMRKLMEMLKQEMSNS